MMLGGYWEDGDKSSFSSGKIVEMSQSQITFKFSYFTFDSLEKRLLKRKRKIDLTPTECDLLQTFLENPGHLFTKDELMKDVWGGVVDESTLSSHISWLRGKLGGDLNAYIQTKPRVGYRWRCKVVVEEKAHKVDNSTISVKESPAEEVGRGFSLLKDLEPLERADFFFDLAQKGSSRMVGSEHYTWLHITEDEYWGFSDALDFYGKTSAWRELEMAVNLAFYWDVRGHWAEGRERLRHALDQQEPGISDVKAKGLTWYGYFSCVLDDYTAARQALSEAVAMAKIIGDDSTLALSLHAFARTAESEGRYVEATDLLRQGLAAAERTKNPWILAQIYRVIGTVALSQGDYRKANEFLWKSLHKREESDAKRGLANYYSRLSVAALAQNDVPQARLLHDKSNQSVRGVLSKPSLGLYHFNLGLIEEVAGQNKLALAAFERSLDLRLEIGEKRGVARSMEACGKIQMMMDNGREGAVRLGMADAVRKQAVAPLSPTEERKYGWWIDEARRKWPKEFEDGAKRVLGDLAVV